MRYFFLLILFLYACSNDKRSIKVKGSDTEVNLAVTRAEQFYQVNPDFSIAISGGGSGLGIASLLASQFGTDELIRSLNNDQVHLNHDLIAQKQLDETAIRSFLVNQLRKIPGIAFAVDMDKVGSSSVPEPIRGRMMNSYHYKRSGVIQIIFDPQWKTGSPTQTGTGHSAWNPYDAHIPLLWLGWGIPQGSSNAVVSMCDIAPTIAAMLHIQEPNGNVGKPISFDKK